jgi:hypothetical protein
MASSSAQGQDTDEPGPSRTRIVGGTTRLWEPEPGKWPWWLSRTLSDSLKEQLQGQMDILMRNSNGLNPGSKILLLGVLACLQWKGDNPIAAELFNSILPTEDDLHELDDEDMLLEVWKDRGQTLPEHSDNSLPG